MKNLKPTLLFAILLILSACQRAYVSPDFEQRTNDHQIIAVLPFEMVFTGNYPKDLTVADIREIEAAESKAFQISFYNELLRSARREKKRMRINIQSPFKTAEVLEAHDITIRESWTADTDELRKLLGVDAVVRGRIQKTRIMSDLASFGIDLGLNILNVLTNPAGLVFPWGASRNKEVQAIYSLTDEDNGTTLWGIDYYEDANWSESSDQIINNINRRAARRFPYRQGK